MFRIKVVVPKGKLFGVQLDRMRDLAVITRKWPQVMRFGPGSLDEQIRQRTHFTRSGSRVAWDEPSYVSGASAFNSAALLEDVMWQSVRGGPGSITRNTAFTATVGVDDRSVRIRSAELGNKIVSSAPYFSFVTGSFQERESPARAKPAKPTKTGRGAFPFNTAMYWFLKLQFNYTASAEELSAGIPVPPKNLGINPTMVRRLTEMTRRYIVTGSA